MRRSVEVVEQSYGVSHPVVATNLITLASALLLGHGPAR